MSLFPPQHVGFPCVVSRLDPPDAHASARLALASLSQHVQRLHQLVHDWPQDIEIALHVEQSIGALLRLAAAVDLDSNEVIPQETCTECGRPCVEWRREAGNIVCVLCRNDEDADAQFRRIGRAVDRLALELDVTHEDEAFVSRLTKELEGI